MFNFNVTRRFRTEDFEGDIRTFLESFVYDELLYISEIEETNTNPKFNVVFNIHELSFVASFHHDASFRNLLCFHTHVEEDMSVAIEILRDTIKKAEAQRKELEELVREKMSHLVR